MQKYKQLYRTTLDQTEELPLYGVYILAYMGAIVYVGITTKGIGYRLGQHIAAGDPVGVWMRLVDDWPNVRLDVLEPADCADVSWMRQAEGQLVRRFAPVFNTMLQA